jgi:hypothetical protein
MKEIFKEIEGYEGLYEISNLERVKSLAKIWTTGYKVHTKDDTFLKGKDNGAGRRFVILSKNGQKNRYYIDELVKKYLGGRIRWFWQ